MSSSGSAEDSSGAERHAAYFFAPGCPDCDEVDRTVIPELIERGFLVDRINVETAEGFQRLRRVEGDSGTKCETLAPVILYAGTVFCGPARISEFFLTNSFLQSSREAD